MLRHVMSLLSPRPSPTASPMSLVCHHHLWRCLHLPSSVTAGPSSNSRILSDLYKFSSGFVHATKTKRLLVILSASIILSVHPSVNSIDAVVDVDVQCKLYLETHRCSPAELVIPHSANAPYVIYQRMFLVFPFSHLSTKTDRVLQFTILRENVINDFLLLI